MTRLEKTVALVLRVTPFSNTSHVVFWLSEDGARVTTVVKGACRARSEFLGQYDLFYTCELVYYVRDHGGLHVARECTPLESRDRLRTDWTAAAAASYLCDLTMRTSEPGMHLPGAYALLRDSLDQFAVRGGDLRVVHWFELKILECLGLKPELNTCGVCRKDISAAVSRPLPFSAPAGGIRCRGCEPDGQSSVMVDPAALSALRAWQRSSSPRYAANTVCPPNQMLAFRTVLGAFLRYHLDVLLPSRGVALDLLSSGPPTV